VSVADPAWLEELFSYLRIPSVSADPARAGDVQAACEWLCDFVRGAGGSCEVRPTSTHPLVIGEIPASSGQREAPTVLLYGHADVQSAGRLELWESDPFEPEVRNGWIYGRGVADDKGNSYLLLKAAELLAGAGRLPVNVRIAFDAEEEIGGHEIVDFLAADERGADGCLIFDSGMVRIDAPAFAIATRGIVYLHVTLRTGERDLHSGIFGGAALNAVEALAAALTAVAATPEALRRGTIPPSDEELESWRALDPGEQVLAEQGARPADARAAEEFYERTGARAAVTVHGLHGGEPELQKTVLPVEAHANVSIRLAPGQDVEEIAAALERLLHAAAPAGAELTVERWASSPPGLVSPDAAFVRLAQDAFERVTGVRPLLVRSGGTLPIVPALAGRGIPLVVTGFDVPEGNVHAPNERLLERYLPLGVATAQELLTAFAELPLSGR
jgi:acetylornithine deacetylase/succinyl-diaminopimelate desuccinylase-like protein